ncbi:TonB-dependent receptor [Starkeya sp. ORNL1]|uniref:TonB-dependent receptor domain-containing protein n=1 Tax=Starkeya sp. ORNL1 TaxID=2709380 RepID=UPI001462CAF7|nr:TonB-dependent receptor [Starkeya sp. ORNL1]QJP15883.1 TonB-dependent receptor [Starkeya sp. ORNL1]
MKRRVSARRRLLCGASALVLTMAAMSLLHPGAALAQAAAQPQARSWQFNIPAKPLLAALADFTALTGVQVVRSSGEALGGSSAPVSGTLTAAQALARLLAGTGLSARFTNASTVVLSRPGEATRPVGVAPDGSEELDPIDVTANVPPADAPYATPGPVSYISGEQVERLPPTSLGDIFRDTPGVIATGNRIGASVDLNIRGLQGQNRINVMVDGTRQTNSSYRGYRGSRNEVYIDPDFIGGVDINKGPYGGAGGVGAMGGVVNMRTIEAGDILKPGAEYGARLKGSLGSNTVTPPGAHSYDYETSAPDFFNGDAWSGSVAAGLKKDNYEFVAAASRRKAGNYFVGTNGADSFLDDRTGGTPVERALSPIKPGWEAFNTSQDVASFLTKGKVGWGDGQALELGYIYYNNKYGDYNETLLSFVGHPTIITPYEQFGLAETTTNTFTSKYTYDPDSDYINFTAHAWVSDVETFSQVLKDFNAVPEADGKTHIRTYGGDAANISLFDTPLGQLRVNNGAETVYEMADENPVYSYGLQSKNPSGNRLLLSAFNQSKLEMTDWLALLGGLRYDYYELTPTDQLSDYPAKDGGRLNPSAGVELTLAKGFQLFGLYTEGWRPPSLRESASLTFATVLPNPDLEPETSKNAEFGTNLLRDDVFIAGDKLRLKASYFNNNYDNYIIRTRIPDNPSYYTWTNIPRAKFVGYELSGSYDAGKFFVEASFTRYTDIQFCGEGGVCGFDVASGDYGLVSIPPEYSGTITAGIRLFDEALTLGGRAYFFGERYGGYRLLGGAVNAPTYWTSNTIVDFFGSYKFNDDVTWDFSLENAFDRYYLDPLSTGLLPSPGRTMRTSVSWRF